VGFGHSVVTYEAEPNVAKGRVVEDTLNDLEELDGGLALFIAQRTLAGSIILKHCAERLQPFRRPMLPHRFLPILPFVDVEIINAFHVQELCDVIPPPVKVGEALGFDGLEMIDIRDRPLQANVQFLHDHLGA
jgi:hypothetical protein